MLRADFSKIPERFLVCYQPEILAWARDLDRRGPKLAIELMKPAVPSVIHVEGVQPRVTLRCDLFRKRSGADAIMVVQADTPMDAEIIARHCEELPKIGFPANGNAAKAKARKHVDAVFEGIPEEFVQAYSLELMSWGGDFKRRGPNATIVLRRIPNMPVAVDAHGQPPMVGVHLSAKVDRARRGDDYVRLVISPETEEDRGRIVRHVADIARFGPPAAPVGRPRDRASIEVPGVQ